MRLRLEQIYIANLEQTRIMAHMTKESAYEALKELTQQDFGYDAMAWKAWFKEHPPNWKAWFKKHPPNWKIENE